MRRQVFFPFELHATDSHGWAANPTDFKETFLKHKPAELSWYAYDVRIISQTQIEFIVFNMRDTCYGGIGREIAHFACTVDPAVTRNSIEKRAMRLAIEKRETEIAAAERSVIKSYADELLKGIL